MKKKKWQVPLVAIIVACAICYGLIYIPRKIVRIEPSKVSSIKIFDGNTGKSITITSSENINHIIGNLNSITFRTDKLSLGYLGYSFNTTIYKSNGKVYKEFIINSKDTIRKDPFFYRASTKNIDYDYIKDLMEGNL